MHQIFSGPVGGDALLILDHAAAGMLKELLTNEPPLPLALDASAREVLTEVGNILLNACLGTFGNLLQVQVSFSVPHLNLDTLHERAASRCWSTAKGCATRSSSTPGSGCATPRCTGYLVIVLSVASLDG